MISKNSESERQEVIFLSLARFIAADKCRRKIVNFVHQPYCKRI